MEFGSAHSLYLALSGCRSSLLYSGAFTDARTADLVAWGEALLDAEERPTLRNRLTFVMVEAYQNIVRHRALVGSQLERGAGRSLFLLRHKGSGNEVVAVNPVLREEAGGLRSLLERLRGLDIAQLKQLFLQRLRAEERTTRGGAGLGLIEMARRSGQEMGHVLTTIDADHELFMLRVIVGGTSEESADALALRALHELVVREDVLLAATGLFSPAIQRVVVRLVADEMELSGVPRAPAMRIMHAVLGLVDTLGLDREGALLVVHRGATRPVLALLVRMDASLADRMLMAHATVQEADPARREVLYRNTLLDRPDGVDREFLGLLELQRSCTGPVRVELGRTTDGMHILIHSCL
jgi:hypothetical protein